MSIDRVFPEEAAYIVDKVCPQAPDAVAREKLRDFFAANPSDVAWAFYSQGPFGLVAVRDGVEANPDGTLNIARRYADTLDRRLESTPIDDYLKGVDCVYLQLFGQRDQAGGIERHPSGAQVGHYEFANGI